MNRLITVLSLALGLLVVPHTAMAITYYVDSGPSGNDARTAAEAQNPGTPWKTIKKGLESALSGDTIKVNPGTYAEGVESRRDGAPGAPIVLESTVVGGAVIQPPAGTPGFFISHNYHAIVGFTVTGATIGIRLGGHDGGGSVVGLLVQSNTVSSNSSNGIQVTSGLSTEIAFNTVNNNGANGISYSGNSSLIHDNVVHHNAQFGIYVKDGVDHVVYDNTSFSNVQTNLKIVGATLPSPAVIYYVDCQTGDDSRTATEAKNSATPWKSIKTALAIADGGDTIMVLGGTVQAPRVCSESLIESKRAGSVGSPITIKAATAGAVVIAPPSGNGFFVSHDYHTIDGFVVTGATNGIQVQGGDGVVISNSRIGSNTQAGVKVSGATGVTVMHNVIFGNPKQGVICDTSTRANIFNNLVYSNGSSGAWGIEISSGNGHRVVNNTVWGHTSAGSGAIRLGTSSSTLVFSTVVNNIVVNNRVGIKEPAGSGYTGIAKLEFNDVFANTTNYDLSPTGSVIGASSISQDPRFVSVDPLSGNFLQLSRVASGQAVDSPCIDKGSSAADTLGLGTRSPFTNKAHDTGRVDLGYHWPLNLVQGPVTDVGASVTINSGPNNDAFTLSLRLMAGAGSDGIELGTGDAELSFGSLSYSLPVSGFHPSGAPGAWTYASAPGQPVLAGTFTKLPDGSVIVGVTGSGLNLSSSSPIPVWIRIGDDFGSFQATL